MPSRLPRLVRARLALLLPAALACLALAPAAARAADPCATAANPVACENGKPGDPPSDWQTQGNGDPSLQGYATSMSVDKGQTVSFKIKTDASSYTIDILRLGYYGGDGARIVAGNIKPSATLPQAQPACLTDASTGLVDCGNWSASASWTVPSDAISGVYIAHLVRTDTGGDSQIPFVVRDDASHSDVLLQTSDTTWQAYNKYGGNSLYSCTVACPPGNPQAYKGAFAVSYNRPFDGTISQDNGRSYLYYAEYQLIRFIERNGYDVSYTSGADVDNRGGLLKNHALFVSSGHDEYWSGAQRANVESARDAGVSLAFFSGNEVFWKTRWQPSIDGANTSYRTLVTYKETHFDSPVDPQDPPTWTGTWSDPRFSPPGDGGRPANALTGQQFLVNSGTTDIKVPSQYSRLRFWRNTGVANLTAGQTLTLSPGTGTLGFEWDSDLDNGFRPAGMFDLSATTATGLQTFTDFGTSVVSNSSATHNLTLYRAPSGALVFGAGTVQWAWGLDDTNAWHHSATDPSGNPPDPDMQQATVNLFADMGAQPAALQPGLIAAAQSTDTTAPSARIAAPADGATVQDGASTTISGTASDAGGTVAGVEVSTDNGSTWHPADGTSSWSSSWVAHGSPAAIVKVRATDDSGNVGTPASATVNVPCPCSLFGTGAAVPAAQVDSGDAQKVEVGVKFRSDVFGTVTGIRFYKAAANTGTHVGSLWTADGTRLAQATFSNESASGWQSVTFASPVPINPGTTYVASYFAPAGHYSASPNSFYKPSPLGATSFDSPPLHAINANGNNANGVYRYGASSFPINSFKASNYWVDVMFGASGAPGQVTNVSATAGAGSATISWSAPADGGPPTKYVVTPYVGTSAQEPTTVTGSPLPTTARIDSLTGGKTYTFTVQASNGAGDGPASAPSNAVTPTTTTPPTAPTAVTASAATSSARVSWTAPSSDGGKPISAYTVTPFAGTTAQTPISVGGSTTSTVVSGLTNGTSYTFTVTATNAVGDSPPSAPSNAVTPEATIFDSATPAVVDSGDASAVEVGVKFRSDVFGVIKGIRFYKAGTNVGTHTGSVWKADGTRIAQATFTNETASGWQEADFATPVPIDANTTYVASYFAPRGHYSNTSPGLSTAVDNPPLHAIANGVSPNGVYSYGATSSFPSKTFNATNYWVDVLFKAAGAPGQVASVSATADVGSANVSWTAPTSGGPVTRYTITPYIGATAQAPTTVTGTPPATSTRVLGLTGGRSYTFTVQPSNGSGDGPVSAPSNAVTPSGGTVPSAPTGVSATAATTSARVSWTPPSADGGTAITGYTVTPYTGSDPQPPVRVDGSTTSATIQGLTNGTGYTFAVTATNATGDSPASIRSSAVVPGNTIFEFGTPGTVDSNDTHSTVLGVKFTSDVAGTITGIRFYKATANTGTHVGTLWAADGTKLAQATFSGETASGWQEVDFATPILISANTTYVASYLAPRGRYAANAAAFKSAGADRPPLHALSALTSPDGVYAYSATNVFPTSTFNASNYWVDVLFTPGI